MKPSDVEAEVAKRLNLPKEQVRLVMLDFFHHMVTVLQHPERFFYKGLLIEECFKIKLNPAKVAKAYFKNLKNPKIKPLPQHINVDVIHENLLKYEQYNEKQKKWIEDSKRDIESARQAESTLCGEDSSPEI